MQTVSSSAEGVTNTATSTTITTTPATTTTVWFIAKNFHFYRGADKSLAHPTSRYILFDGENILFDASLVICINSANIPPIMIINRIYENQNLLSL
jgi:hypothetical protein